MLVNPLSDLPHGSCKFGDGFTVYLQGAPVQRSTPARFAWLVIVAGLRRACSRFSFVLFVRRESLPYDNHAPALLALL